MTQEEAFSFQVGDDQLVGIIHRTPRLSSKGVLIVVGGPQYRVGSHRQFVLLARYLADQGIPVMRFDYRGMGDSTGCFRGFENIDQDIGGAIDAFFERVQGLQQAVIWGLCDAATAAVFYAYRDPRVGGLVLLNPWVRSEELAAKAVVKAYYADRFMSRAFWSKLFSGGVDIFGAIAGFLKNFWRSFASRSPVRDGSGPERLELSERFYLDWQKFDGQTLIVLSGRDLTASEFEAATVSLEWAAKFESSSVEIHRFPLANHTFSSRELRDSVATMTFRWLRSW